jgi:hypothetical protein
VSDLKQPNPNVEVPSFASDGTEPCAIPLLITNSKSDSRRRKRNLFRRGGAVVNDLAGYDLLYTYSTYEYRDFIANLEKRVEEAEDMVLLARADAIAEHDRRVKAEEFLKRAADKIHVHACGLIRPPHDCASLHRVIDAYFAEEKS